MKPEISIIIPAFNEEKILPRTIEAVRRSCGYAESRCEVVVVDNNSTDSTAKIAHRLGVKVHSEKEQGVGSARNHGAWRARGKILIFLDADTVVPRDLIIRFSAPFKNEKVACVGCNVMPASLPFYQRIFFNLFNFLVHFSIILGRGSVAGNCVAYRASAFRKLGGFREDLVVSEDQDLCFRANKIGKVVYLNDLTVLTSSRRVKKLGFVYFLWEWLWTSLHYVFGVKAKKYKLTR